MEQYNVFILALKEILIVYTPMKIALILIAAIFVYRLPDIIQAVCWW